MEKGGREEDVEEKEMFVRCIGIIILMIGIQLNIQKKTNQRKVLHLYDLNGKI